MAGSFVDAIDETPEKKLHSRNSMVPRKLLRELQPLHDQDLLQSQFILIEDIDQLSAASFHQSMYTPAVQDDVPPPARSSTSKPMSTGAGDKSGQNTPGPSQYAPESIINIIESPLMISGMLNEETAFEARQRKAKVKWDYLLQFGKYCAVSQSIHPSCFKLYSIES